MARHNFLTAEDRQESLGVSLFVYVRSEREKERRKEMEGRRRRRKKNTPEKLKGQITNKEEAQSEALKITKNPARGRKKGNV